MWEFAGSEYLADGLATIDEVRTAPGVTALSGASYAQACQDFAKELASVVGASPSRRIRLGVGRMDHEITDELRRAGFDLVNATSVFMQSRCIKLPIEVTAMREAMRRVEAAVDSMLKGLEPGATEVEV